jgi:prolyl oligopeptidase
MQLSTRLLTAAVMTAMATTALAQAPTTRKLDYPVARKGATVDTYFGVKVPAPYQWMENLEDPALHPWADAENRVTDAYFAKIPVRGWIDHHLTELWNYAKESTPEQLQNGMLFFGRNSGLQNQDVVYPQGSVTAKPRALIDPNKLSPDGSIALAGVEPSHDGKLAAYQLSAGGSDWEIIHVMDTATGKALPDEVQWVKFSDVSWTHDGKGFFYSRFPQPPTGREAKINQKGVDQTLYYHRFGTPQADDKLVYAMPGHPEWLVDAQVSEDGRYLLHRPRVLDARWLVGRPRNRIVVPTNPRSECDPGSALGLASPRRFPVPAPASPRASGNDESKAHAPR